MRIKYALLIQIFCLLNHSHINAQPIWTNPITDPNPSALNPFWIGDVAAPNMSVSGIGRGPGITGLSSTDRYNATGWNSAAWDANDYYEFEMKPDADCVINLINFQYVGQTTLVNSPTNFAFRSNLDGYASNIGSPTSTGTTIDLSAPAFQNISGTVIFRLYAWGAGSGSGQFSVNSFNFNGTTQCGVILPIEFLSFSAGKVEAGVALKWITASENNTKKYVIEFSEDGDEFIQIGEVEAIGNSSVHSTYDYFDRRDFLVNTVYYRLKIVDNDGDFSYSETRAVNTNAMYVSFSNQQLHFNLSSDKDMNIKVYIYDMLGQIVEFLILPANEYYTINWQNHGVYFLTAPELNIAFKFNT